MKIILTKLALVLLMVIPFVDADAQNKEQGQPFNCVVTDLLGNPLKKVRGYLRTPEVYATSDKKGRIGFSSVSDNDTIHLVYNKEIYLVPVQGRKGLRIKLGDQLTALTENDDHLVDLGYGFVKRREHTRSSSGITREDLLRTGQTDLMAALRSRVPGLSISNASPGEKSNVHIRGISSNGNCEPLYLIDGMQVSQLDNVMVQDVEYVEVIKDANIYGAQGANGVISVHTVRGGR